MDGQKAAACLGLDTLQECEGFAELWEACFIGFEFAGMDATTKAAHFHGMLEVQHLVVEKILDRVARTRRAIEDSADHDGVVGGIVVSQGAPGHDFTPGQVGTAEQSIEEPVIERIEDLFEVVEVTMWTCVALAAACVADEFSLTSDRCAGSESLESYVVRRIDRLLVQLGDEDVRDGADHALWCAFDEVGETYKDLAFAQTDGGVEGSEAAETNRDRRDRRPWA